MSRLHAQEAPAMALAEAGAPPDGAIGRWAERITRPLRVFVDTAAASGSWSADHVLAVRTAFDRWVATGIPIRLTFVASPAHADVTVRTVARLAEGISGRTTWRRNAAGWLREGTIWLARIHADGAPLSPEELHAVALHEVGHLLGLSHVADPTRIMAPRIRARSLSPMDEATIRQLYGVPAGTVGPEEPNAFDSVPPPR